jgi:hypothetical protein
MIDLNQIENCEEESAKNPGHYHLYYHTSGSRNARHRPTELTEMSEHQIVHSSRPAMLEMLKHKPLPCSYGVNQ